MPNAAMFCDWYTWLLNNTENWHEKWSKGITEVNVGNPVPFSLDRNSSPTLIQHTYHLAVYERNFNTSITDADAVVEIGGGYGSMCRLFHNLGFAGQYTIFDLPAMAVLQSLYLKDIGLDVAKAGDGDARVRCLHDEDVFFSAMASLPRSARKVLIATWSLSEMPFQQRDKLLARIKDIGFDHIIFAYQTKHCDIDNVDYFKALPELFGQGYHWKIGDIVELPGSRYLLGGRA